MCVTQFLMGRTFVFAIHCTLKPKKTLKLRNRYVQKSRFFPALDVNPVVCLISVTSFLFLYSCPLKEEEPPITWAALGI